jgi:hypothetical protein
MGQLSHVWPSGEVNTAAVPAALLAPTAAKTALPPASP